MGLDEIINRTNSMTDPDKVITGLNVTGMFGDAMVYCVFAVIFFASSFVLDRYSKRLTYAGLISSVIAVGLFAVDFLMVETLYRVLVATCVGFVWMWFDSRKSRLA